MNKNNKISYYNYTNRNMSAFNVSQYFQLLRQQVMSPGAMESQYSVTVSYTHLTLPTN